MLFSDSPVAILCFLDFLLMLFSECVCVFDLWISNTATYKTKALQPFLPTGSLIDSGVFGKGRVVGVGVGLGGLSNSTHVRAHAHTEPDPYTAIDE